MDPTMLIVLLAAGGAAVYVATKAGNANVPASGASEQNNQAKTFSPPAGSQESERQRGINFSYQGNSFGVNW